MSKVVMLVGVPGSGKSWVIERLNGKFEYVSHDTHATKEKLAYSVNAAAQGHKPVIVDCPFAERELLERLDKLGLPVTPVFIVEKPETVGERYFQREKRHAPQATITRAATIRDRAKEWGAKYGSSSEILKYLLTY